MEKNETIKNKYMTVGEIAKKMGVTVRTMQYYDKEGLLSPSSESEGGRRRYTDKDLVKLHQILSMKHLGFSLDDIKNRLIPLDVPEDVANALDQQALVLREKIKTLSDSLMDIETLKSEVLQMQSVDFKKYADIIVNLQMKNEYYWLIKHFDETTLDYIRNRFDKDNGLAIIEKFNLLQERAIEMHNCGIPPESEQGIAFAKEFWDMIMEFTNGDMSLLPKLMEFGNANSSNPEWNQRLAHFNAFSEPALGAYFDSIGYNPFQEVSQ